MDTCRIRVCCSLVLVEFDNKHPGKIRLWVLICNLINLELLKLNTQISLKQVFTLLYLFSLKLPQVWQIFHFLYLLPFPFNTYPERTGRNGSISVRALDGPKASIVPSTYHSVSPPGYTILDVDANAMLFVGGLTGKLKVMCFSHPVYFIFVGYNSWHDYSEGRHDKVL